MAHLALISRMWGCFFHIILPRIANLAKTDGKARSPTPCPEKKVEYGKMVCFGLRAASSLISGRSEDGSLFHFILFKIVGV